MNINIFLLCYNESSLLPHTINHYKKYLPSSKITIYDNMSTDNSVEVATSLGCKVIPWNSDNIIDDYKYRYIKNNCWKVISDGWIIAADMDEFLCITESDLYSETQLGTSIITVKGLDMIGESKKIDLTDIDLQLINKFTPNKFEDKSLCFYRNSIGEMNYNLGAHKCNPIGSVKYSEKIYYNKHMSNLGLDYIVNKTLNRYKRSTKMRSSGLAIHYTDNIQNITDDYNNKLQNSRILEF